MNKEKKPVRCKGRNKDGSQCSRNATFQGYCIQCYHKYNDSK